MGLASIKKGNFLELTHDGSTAWKWNDSSHGWSDFDKMRLKYIMWIPNAANDVISIKDGSIVGPRIFYAKAADVYDQRIIYMPNKDVQPVIDESATTGADQVIVFCVR